MWSGTRLAIFPSIILILTLLIAIIAFICWNLAMTYQTRLYRVAGVVSPTIITPDVNRQATDIPVIHDLWVDMRAPSTITKGRHSSSPSYSNSALPAKTDYEEISPSIPVRLALLRVFLPRSDLPIYSHVSFLSPFTSWPPNLHHTFLPH